MDHTPEELEVIPNDGNQKPAYKEHTLLHRIVSWILIAIVLVGFIGSCYWMAFYGV